MTNNKIGNEVAVISPVVAAEIVYRGRAYTAEGYMYTGTTPKDGRVIGITCILDEVAIGDSPPLATVQGTRVIVESGAALAIGDLAYSDTVGRATTVTTTGIKLGTVLSAASAAGEETELLMNIEQ